MVVQILLTCISCLCASLAFSRETVFDHTYVLERSSVTLARSLGTVFDLQPHLMSTYSMGAA